MYHLAMASPEGFDVAYELSDNKWMKVTNRPDKNLARNQWAMLKKIYERIGVGLVIEPAAPDLPDFVFIANAGLAYKNKFVLSNFRHRERRPEKEYNKAFFETMNADIIELHPDTYFEGQGDALWVGDGLLMGHGFRSSLDAAAQLEKHLNVQVLPIRLVQPPRGNKIFYHLDTCYLHLERAGVSIAVQRAFDRDSWRILDGLCELKDLDSIDKKAAEMLFCNSIEIENYLITPYLSKPLEKLLDSLDYTPIKVDLSQFLKSGGAVRCMTLELTR